jgi:hypothetical protein
VVDQKKATEQQQAQQREAGIRRAISAADAKRLEEIQRESRIEAREKREKLRRDYGASRRPRNGTRTTRAGPGGPNRWACAAVFPGSWVAPGKPGAAWWPTAEASG